MPLTPASRLGPYEILSPLGAGGMGEVFLARDSRLGREVAIKALPDAFAHDPERLARFEREARLLASLKHPNIAGIYGLEEADGHRYLILEYVPGPTLADRLASGPLALDETLDVCAQIAAGLEAAHESGVVHRDLKPANIKLTPAGEVKVLDFGLAKGGATAGSSSGHLDLSNSPTIAAQAATTAGVILGTAAYMSPEQARGKVVDRRTDIWSFGCVLYECLTGRPLHSGETISDLIAHILTSEPDWSALPANTPARLRELLARCLRKDPRERLRDIGDARLELAEIRARSSEAAANGAATPAPAAARRGWPLLARVVATLFALVALGAVAALLAPRTPPARVTRSTMLAPDMTAFVSNALSYALAPDGHAIVLVQIDRAGTSRLFVRDVASMEWRLLAGTEDAQFPFWSPDSRDIGFFSRGHLRRVAAAGGSVRDLCEAHEPRGGTWGNGQIVFAPSPRGPLYAVDDDGGTPRAVTALDSTKHEISHRFPVFLPDGRHFVFATSLVGTDRTSPICIASLDDAHARVLMEASTAPVFAGPDWLVFLRDRALFAQRLDLRARTLRGRPILLEEPLETEGGIAVCPTVSCSNDGAMIYIPKEQRPRDLMWFAPDGHVTPTGVRLDATTSFARLSPDNRRVAVNGSGAEGFSIQLAFLDQKRVAQIAPPGRGPMYPAWDASGTHVMGPIRTGSGDVMSLDMGNGAESVFVPGGNGWRVALGMTHDATALLYAELTTDQRYDLGYVTLADHKEHTYLATPADEGLAAISHDGRWIAYTSDASGRSETYMDAFPEHATAVRVGPGAPTGPFGGGGIWWSRDDRQLYFTAPDGLTIDVADVHTGSQLSVGEPRAFMTLPQNYGYDFAPELGKAIALVAVGVRPAALTMVQHWPSGVKEGR